MVELIAFIIFITSALAIVWILFKKTPLLLALPKNGHHGIKKHQLISDLEKKIKTAYFHFFEKQMLLHKVLSFVKVWTLKIETKVDHLLHGIRKKAQELDKNIKKKK